jgi:allantoinase
VEFTSSEGRLSIRDDKVDGPAREFVGYGQFPPRVLWPHNARVAVSFVINYEEGSEYSTPSGDATGEKLGEYGSATPPNARDLRTESVFEYGSRAGIWRLVDLVDRHAIPVTFFAAAVALTRNPDLARYLRGSEHEVCSHGWRWSEHWRFDREEERRRIVEAVRTIEELCGRRPVGWNCRNSASVNTRQLLIEEGGFLYDSDAYNDDLPYFVKHGDARHLVLPYSVIFNDIRYVQPQGFGSPRDFVDTCVAGFDYLWDEGAHTPKMMSIGLHPRLSGQPARAAAVREVIEHIQNKGSVWIARRADIARFWIDASAGFEPTRGSKP